MSKKVTDPDAMPSLGDVAAAALGAKPTLVKSSLADMFARPSALSANSAFLEAAKNARGLEATNSFADYVRSMESRESLTKEIAALRKEVAEKANALESEKSSGGKSRKKIEELERSVDELRLKEDLGFLLTRVSTKAQEKLLADESFRAAFAEDRECRAFVMSVDIRRSTELMLKARQPSLFANFISRLTKELYECVVRNNGVFDKFTGDGVLAFFPEGFSGKDYGYSVLKAAAECHQSFDLIYRESRNSFTSVLKGIGLGIGIDYGSVRLLRVAEGLTVVGVPVVYACRLSGAKPGQTLVNQPAYEVIHGDFGQKCVFEESSLEIKHEGEVLAYSATLGHERFSPERPEWMVD